MLERITNTHFDLDNLVKVKTVCCARRDVVATIEDVEE